jgi:AAA ATPase domain/Adenylate and Guanylate cyclase catalytic domain
MGVATVAVLFTDLVDSTATAERVGPAEADRSRREHFDALRAVVRSHRGTEVKSTGDGLMVVFASPSDAVACAGALQAAQNWSAPEPTMRVGVSVGEATNEDDDWFGLPVVRAARLCGAAQPGEVLVDELVAALADRASATLEPVGELALKGLSRPVPTLRLVWEAGGGEVPLPGALRPTGVPFVGRDGELERLAAAWARAGDGQTVLALLGGEPGAGKTSIAAAFARGRHVDGATVLFGRCQDGPGLAYQPWAQALGRWVRHADAAELSAHVAAHGGELARLTDDLAKRVPDLPPPHPGDPDTEQWRLFSAVHGLLATAGRRSPVLVVLDDVHWASAPTLQLLIHLLQQEEPASLLIVATYRDTELSRSHPLADVLAELRREAAVERIRVGGLDADGVVALVEAMAAHELAEADRSLAVAVHDRTEGNPFFVVEVLRLLVESGAIVRDGDRWRAGELQPALLPEGVREVVGRRLRRLSDEANRALSVAAVVGLEFDVDIVARAVARDTGALLDELDGAREAGIVAEVGPGRYAFTHALIRSTVGEEAGASRQVHLHGRVAAAIEELHADALDPWLADLAYHYAESATAARVEPAVEYALRAAEQARSQAAVDEAVAILEQGVAAARLAEPVDDRLLARVLVALAETTAIVRPVEGRAWAEEAAAAAERAAAPELVVAAAASMWSVFNTTVAGSVGGDRWLIDLCARGIAAGERADPALRARVLAMHVLMSGWLREPADIGGADEAVDLALTTGDLVARIIAGEARFFARTQGAFSLDDWPGFLAVLDGVRQDTSDPYLRGMAAIYQSWGASWMGDAARFDEAHAEVRTFGTELVGARLPTWDRWLAAMAAARRGDWAAAVDHATAAAETSTDEVIGASMVSLHLGQRLLNQGGREEIEPVIAALRGEEAGFGLLRRAFLAALLAVAGDHDDALARLDRIVADEAIDTDVTRGVAMGVALRAALTVGHVEAARAFRRRLEPYRGVMVSAGMAEIGAVDSFLAAVLAMEGRHDEAQELFRSGLDLEEGFGATAMAAQTRYWWAQSLLGRDAAGDREQAASLLAESRAVAERLGMAPLLRLLQAG